MDQYPFQTSPSSNDLSPVSVSHRRKVLPIAFYLGIVVVVLGTAMLWVQFGVTDGLTFAPFTFGPLILALIPMWRYRSRRSQAVLIFTDIAYLSWFLIYMQFGSAYRSGFNAFGVAIYSFSVVLVLSLFAARIHRLDSQSTAIAAPSFSSFPPIAFYLSVGTVILGTLMLCFHFGFIGGTFGLPIAFGPLMLAWIPMWLCCSKRSQSTLVVANIAFACWFLYVYVPLRHPHPWSEFDSLEILAIGIYSIPVLFVFCIAAMVLHWQDSRLPR